MDTSKPFIGYRSAGRRPERQNDREGAKGAPLAAIRGWIAGTAGLPGDLEGLARMVVGAERQEPVLPTSDFYKEWLPLRGESPVERAFTEAGSLAGGAGVGSAVRGVERGVSAGARGALGVVQAAARNAQVPVRLNPQAGVIKMKGGDWLDGSVEDSIKPLQVRVRTEGINGHTAENTLSDQALNTWLDKKLARYIKNEMATPEDPVRALAERGVLHVNPEQLNFRPEMHGKYLEAGQTAMAQNPLAQVWEGASDLKVSPMTARQLMGGDEWVPDVGDALAQNTWLAKVPPDTPVYGVSEARSLPGDLGFSHLIDELRNATNPESGLPRELLLKYDALGRVTVPQAVERVSKINEWRAAQKAKADLARANNAATVLHKEYPEGYRWVELKDVPDAPLPEGWTRHVDRDTGKSFLMDPSGRKTTENPLLKDALKYEGDTMGHCVGGYCDDVASGKSRIYSLRDKKGQPHTTIEIAPQSVGTPDDLNGFIAKNNLRGQFSEDPDSVYEAYEVYLESLPKDAPHRIVQIKGKGNKAPNPEYLPYVQDFVRSGKWSDVGDLQNTGLEMARQKFNETALRALESQGRPVPEFATRQEIEELRSLFGSLPAEARGVKPPEGFAQGGAVNVGGYDEARVNALVEQLGAEFAQ